MYYHVLGIRGLVWNKKFKDIRTCRQDVLTAILEYNVELHHVVGETILDFTIQKEDQYATGICELLSQVAKQVARYHFRRTPLHGKGRVLVVEWEGTGGDKGLTVWVCELIAQFREVLFVRLLMVRSTLPNEVAY